MSRRKSACRICGGNLPEPATRGRPAVYCSVPCRRYAEAQRTGLLRHLERLRERRVDVLLDLAEQHYGLRDRAPLEALEAEIVDTEARLLALFRQEEPSA